MARGPRDVCSGVETVVSTVTLVARAVAGEKDAGGGAAGPSYE